MNKKIAVIYTAAFLTIVFGFGLSGILTPDRPLSVIENRTLSQLPAVRGESLTTRRFYQELEQYANDQIVLREPMVGLYQRQQSSDLFNAMLFENWFGTRTPRAPDDGTKATNMRFIANLAVINHRWILPKTDKVVHTNAIDTATAKLNEAIKLAQGQSIETYFVFNPSRTRALMHLYPSYMQTDAYDRSKAYFLSRLGENVNVIDTGARFDGFTKTRREQLYLETDHHWNIEGAFLAYQTMIEQLAARSPQFEDQPLSLADIQTSRLKYGRFEGSYNRQIHYAVDPYEADRTVLYKPVVPFSFSRFAVVNTDGSANHDSFDEFYGFKSGKSTYTYGSIYGGDRRKISYVNPQANNDLNVLLLKDSYMNPLTPYLARHFGRLTVYDGRYDPAFSLSRVLAEEHYDMLIIAFHDDNLFSGTYDFEKQGQP